MIYRLLILVLLFSSLNAQEKKVSVVTRFGYVAPMLAGFALQGCADARTYTSRGKWNTLSPFATNDFFYLGVRHGSFVAGVSFAALGSYGSNKQTHWRFVKDTAAVILIGSALFDIAFSLERSGRPVMDLSNWYEHNGHKIPISKEGMVIFNVSRIAAGIYLLVKG